MEAADKNVLVIAYYFPPMGLSGVQRTLKFVKYLPEYGWNPVVLTSTPRAFYAYDDALLEEIEAMNVEVYRTEAGSSGSEAKKLPKLTKFPSYTVQKMGRAVLQTIYQPDSKIRWKKPALELGRKILSEKKIDVIFATAPPFTDFLIAKQLSDEFNIPFVVDYRDVWIDNPFHFYATPFHKMYSVNLETEILTYAKRGIVTNRHAKELLLKRYALLKHDDVTIIPHGYDEDDFAPYRNVRPDRDFFTITHSGLFQDDRSPKYFLKALSQFLADNPSAAGKIKAKFLGLMRPGHEKYIKKYKLTGIAECTGYLSHGDSIKELMASDALWLMLNDTVRSPGKLYEYFGARKPILACLPDGAMKKLALDTKATIATYPKDVASIKSAIGRFYEMWQKNILPTPDREYTNSFDRKLLTSQLARELSNAMDI
jgi:glycosyltransferase involved in cell wall biosynthesis